MQLVQECTLSPDAHIIDIGGGDSLFVDALLAKGYHNIYVLDISAKAIESAKQRLGAKAAGVNWIVGDVTSFAPGIRFDLWHDRAAFHFLTSEKEVSRYVAVAGSSVCRNGTMILGTFADDGPGTCSGLQVSQYNKITLPAKFAGAFEKIRCLTDHHQTPSGKPQPFLFCSFQRLLII